MCYKSVQSFRVTCLFTGQNNTKAYGTITRASSKHNFEHCYRALTQLRLQSLDICLKNKPRVGTPIRQNLLTTVGIQKPCNRNPDILDVKFLQCQVT